MSKSLPRRARSARKLKGSPPSNSDSGLSSKLNFDWAIRVFENSTPEDIGQLLKRVGYKERKAASASSLNNHVADYLKTANGKQELASRKKEALNRKVEEWLESEAGRTCFQEMAASVLASELADDLDVFERACHDEIERRVARWLSSPRGQEALEQEKHRRIVKTTSSGLGTSIHPMKRQQSDRENENA